MFIIIYIRQINLKHEDENVFVTRATQRGDRKPKWFNLKSSGKHTIQAGIRLYNALPLHIKSIKAPDVFKIKLKAYLVDKCFYKIIDFCPNF